jgi:hypothetical protein
MSETSNAVRRLRVGFSIAVAVVIIAVVVSIWFPRVTYVAAVAAFFALTMAFPLVRRSQRLIGVVMVSVGVITFVIAVTLGFEVVPLDLLNLNQDMVGMLGAVAFLGFIARTVGEVRPRLSGAPAVWRTALMTHVLGSVINMSAVTVVGDYLRRATGEIRPADAMIMTRSFAAAGFWSPLWAGAALALAFTPTANFAIVAGVGIPFAFVVLALSMPTVFRALGNDLPEYQGYAISWQLLRIPVLLMATVLLLHFVLLPAVTVPKLVALSALAVTVVATVLRDPRRFGPNFLAEVKLTLPGVSSEVSLFVSAGIMALGLGALISAVNFRLPFDGYSVWIAWAGIIVMVALVIMGVHQVISVGFIGTLVMPLHPDPTLFTAAIAMGWGTSVAAGPLTGLQMYMQGRYNVSGTATSKRNIPYFAACLILSLPALFLVQWLSGLAAG